MAHEDARGASIHHVRKSLVPLGGIMKFAVRKGLVSSNPVTEIEKPHSRSRYRASDEMNIFRSDETRHFLTHVDGLKHQTLLTLAIMSRAGQGGPLALTWPDID